MAATREPWEQAVIDALVASGRPYVVIVVDQPMQAGETAVFASGPVLWARSNMVRASLLYVTEQALKNMRQEESQRDESAKRSAN